ncbi:MAG: hypothetical protein MK135_01610 [Polyangiaceae bacterium]|nr:hypothetical protein [Polyangiaceae bacterium]
MLLLFSCRPIPSVTTSSEQLKEPESSGVGGSTMRQALFGGAAPTETTESSDSDVRASTNDPARAAAQSARTYEVKCGVASACDREARKLCPGGYEELSSTETAKAGWRPIFAPAGSVQGPGQAEPGAYNPGAPVPQTRLKIRCY